MIKARAYAHGSRLETLMKWWSLHRARALRAQGH